MDTKMYRSRRPIGIAFVVLALACALFVGCSNKICDCLKEEEKQNPDQAVLDKCREAFAQMEMDEIKKAIDDCGK